MGFTHGEEGIGTRRQRQAQVKGPLEPPPGAGGGQEGSSPRDYQGSSALRTP